MIQQMAGYSNRMVNEASPIVDTRLADGSRVNIVLEPVAIDGSAVTIRKFRKIRSVWRISSGWEASHRKRQIY